MLCLYNIDTLNICMKEFGSKLLFFGQNDNYENLLVQPRKTRPENKSNTFNKFNLSYDVASGSEIAPCNKIDKPLVVYRFPGNVMTSITTLRT